jgi:DNA invertase Pin-like site-specific DNA recombinase
LFNGAEAGAFDVVVTRDETRLGGDLYRVGLVLQGLVEAGVRIFYYFTNEEVRLQGATDKLVQAVRSCSAELEREKIAGRTREHSEHKARRGLNVGGRCYGHDNVRLDGVAGVEYRVNEIEAEVVREIFRRYAVCAGIRAIAKELNARGIASPHVGRRGTRSWSPSCIREMLRRERDAGVLVWGREGTAYRRETRVRIERSERECVRVERPELRIVPVEIWDAVRARVDDLATKPWKAGAHGSRPKYLLSGLARCGVCGGPMKAANHKQGRSVIKVCLCAHRHERGAAGTVFAVPSSQSTRRWSVGCNRSC